MLCVCVCVWCVWLCVVCGVCLAEFEEEQIAPVVPEEEPMDDSWITDAPKEFADCDSLVKSTTYCLETLELAASRY